MINENPGKLYPVKDYDFEKPKIQKQIKIDIPNQYDEVPVLSGLFIWIDYFNLLYIQLWFIKLKILSY